MVTVADTITTTTTIEMRAGARAVTRAR